MPALVRPREDAVFGGPLGDGPRPRAGSRSPTRPPERGVAIVFDRAVFPHAWLWQVYGGWRGHHHLALEAWTSHPMELEAAVGAGRARVLQPGEELATEVAFVLFGGLDTVTHVGGEDEGFAVR